MSLCTCLFVLDFRTVPSKEAVDPLLVASFSLELFVISLFAFLFLVELDWTPFLFRCCVPFAFRGCDVR